jgi:hypothetical protein
VLVPITPAMRLSARQAREQLRGRETWNYVFVLILGVVLGVVVVSPLEVALAAPRSIHRSTTACAPVPPSFAVEATGGCNQAQNAALSPSDAVRFRADNPFMRHISGRYERQLC